MVAGWWEVGRLPLKSTETTESQEGRKGGGAAVLCPPQISHFIITVTIVVIMVIIGLIISSSNSLSLHELFCQMLKKAKLSEIRNSFPIFLIPSSFQVARFYIDYEPHNKTCP